MTGFIIEIFVGGLFMGAIVGFFVGCAFQKHMDDAPRARGKRF